MSTSSFNQKLTDISTNLRPSFLLTGNDCINKVTTDDKEVDIPTKLRQGYGKTLWKRYGNAKASTFLDCSPFLQYQRPIDENSRICILDCSIMHCSTLYCTALCCAKLYCVDHPRPHLGSSMSSLWSNQTKPCWDMPRAGPPLAQPAGIRPW